MKVTSTDSQQTTGRYQDGALFAVLSRGRIARPVEELDDETLRAIANGKVPAGYAPLDGLLKEWSP